MRLTVWFAGGTVPNTGEYATDGMPANGEPLGNTYRSVEYARVFFEQCTIFDVAISMGTETMSGLAQSVKAHKSTTAEPSAVAVGSPQPDQVKFLALMSSVLQTTSTTSGLHLQGVAAKAQHYRRRNRLGGVTARGEQKREHQGHHECGNGLPCPRAHHLIPTEFPLPRQ
jgi:hypothetical protein